MTRRASFTQADIQRMLRAAKAEGFEHPTVDASVDGHLRLLTAPVGPAPVKPASEYDRWAANRGDRAA